jgi:hypothetical protein
MYFIFEDTKLSILKFEFLTIVELEYNCYSSHRREETRTILHMSYRYVYKLIGVVVLSLYYSVQLYSLVSILPRAGIN